MTDSTRMAVDAIQEIYELWQIDDDRVMRVGDEKAADFLEEPFGFDWWPGDFRVQVRVSGPHPEEDEPFYRLGVRTDHIAGVDCSNPGLEEKLGHLNRFTTSFAIITPPREMLKHFQGQGSQLDPQAWRRDAWLASTIYLHEAVKKWVPRFFGTLALFQAIEGPIMAPIHSVLIGGERKSTPMPGNPGPLEMDEMLDVGKMIIKPSGEKTSRWEISGELRRIIDKYGRTEWSYGHAENSRLTLETSFGKESALIEMFTQDPHPRWGNGLLVVVSLPYSCDPKTAFTVAHQLNFSEAQVWNRMGQAFIGSWTAKLLGEGEKACPAYSGFIPNALHTPLLAENILLWSIGRAKWARQSLLPDEIDLPMPEVLKRRFGRG